MHTDPRASRIDRSLADLPPGLWPFLPAGYPDLAATEALIRRCAELPIRGLELGFPFSDPIADGPVIQHAFTRSLDAGLRVESIFQMVHRLRSTVSVPLIVMASASIIYRIGLDAFVTRTADCGLDGLIVPDLSLEEAPRLSELTARSGLGLCMLVAPTTPDDRQARIAQVARGFLYYVSVQGTTGARDRLPTDLADHVARLRAETRLPVLVGFGISSRQQVQEVCRFADGAIVGSAVVQRITELVDSRAEPRRLVDETARLVQSLARP